MVVVRIEKRPLARLPQRWGIFAEGYHSPYMAETAGPDAIGWADHWGAHDWRAEAATGWKETEIIKIRAKSEKTLLKVLAQRLDRHSIGLFNCDDVRVEVGL